jgi:hydroxypyruvate reductase
MVTREDCEAAFHAAVRACDPGNAVRSAMPRGQLVGLAIGKAAVAMARGAGPVSRGLAITLPPGAHGLDEPLPSGWRVMLASHPVPDASSVAAAIAAQQLVDSCATDETLVCLISGGTSALVEMPRDSLTLEELVEKTSRAMAAGASIRELNALRTELSAVKGGKLVGGCRGRVVTLVVSDVIGDDPHVIGSGTTVRHAVGSPTTVRDEPARADETIIVSPMASFGVAIATGLRAHYLAEPFAADVRDVADALAATNGLVVGWGEPTVHVPDGHGDGGRAQQLALELAQRLRGTDRVAFIAGSDGIDGPTRAAGAFVDGSTWDAIVAAGIDAEDALRRCDAGRALDAVGALVISGPTGINFGDVMIVG